MNFFDKYHRENDYSDFDYDRAAAHLSQAIRFQTVSHSDRSQTDFSQFHALHKFIRESYPHLMGKADFRLIGESVLITIPGSDPSLKPALLMSHQDVVPIVSSSAGQWIHSPFSGDIADGYIWGRGAIDIKDMLIGILEAAEYLLARGFSFTRTLYLAFGEDEETMNTGARNIARYLTERNVELEFVLDEGGRIRNGDCYDIEDLTIGEIGMYEKGYVDLRLTARSIGGHSSNPFEGTSLGKLAQSISAIISDPLPARLPHVCLQTLETLKPYIVNQPLKDLVERLPDSGEELLAYYLSNKELYNQVITTIAPTMITPGSSAGNVMPNDMEAVINFRLAPQDSVEQLLAHCRKLIDPTVEMDTLHQVNASTPSDPESYGFTSLKETLHYFFPEIVFVPGVNTTSTDARYYECICNCCMRFEPFLEDTIIRQTGMHGINERISIRAFNQGIRVLIRLIEQTC